MDQGEPRDAPGGVEPAGLSPVGRKLPRVTELRPGPAPTSLGVTFDDGWSGLVDLAGWVAEFDVPGLRDPTVAATVRRAYAGSSVAWGEMQDKQGQGPIEISAWQLWRLAQEQAGEIMPMAAFRAWRRRHALSQRKAAAALGLSARMIAYYNDGTWPVPKTVMLACEGWEARQHRAAA